MADINSWEKEKTLGNTPKSRYSHTAIVYQKVYLIKQRWKNILFLIQCMYIFGGNGDKQPLNDVQQYDFGSKTWAKIKPKGKTPEGRYG